MLSVDDNHLVLPLVWITKPIPGEQVLKLGIGLADIKSANRKLC